MLNPFLTRPEAGEYPAAVSGYIQTLPGGDLLQVLTEQCEDLRSLVGKLSDEQALTRHPPYTWTIKQVVGHLIDSERIFGYRALRIARNDATPLASFDENAYMLAADFDRCPIGELLTEFELVRRSHVLMFGHLNADAWQRAGVVNYHPMTARAVACVMTGHAQHHVNVLHKRLDG